MEINKNPKMSIIPNIRIVYFIFSALTGNSILKIPKGLKNRIRPKIRTMVPGLSDIESLLIFQNTIALTNASPAGRRTQGMQMVKQLINTLLRKSCGGPPLPV
jgi:hypothetical protein